MSTHVVVGASGGIGGRCAPTSSAAGCPSGP